MGDGAAGVHHEVVEQLELLGREMNGPAGFFNKVADRIEHDVADHDGGFDVVEGFAAADRGTQARGEFAQLEGFGNVVVGAGVERLDFALFAALHGEHEDGQARRGLAHEAADFDSAHTGHIDIEKHGIEGFSAHQGERFFAARRLDNFKAEVAENGAQREPDGALVVDDEQVSRGFLIHWLVPPFSGRER